MSNFSGYKTKSFSESQKFFVLDSNTGSPAFVNGSDLVDQITPNSNYVYAENTRTSAQSTDYAVGSLIQTAGATSAGDNFPADYLVVAAGEGDFPMNNGNELLVIRGDEFLREKLAQNTTGNGSDLVAHTGTDDTVTEALDKRTIYVGSVAELEALSLAVGVNVKLTDEIRYGEGTIKTGAAPSDTEKGVYIPIANGNYWERTDKSHPNPRWFGGLVDGTLSDDALQACVTMFPGQRIYLDDGEHNYSTFPTGIDDVRFEGSSRITWTDVELPVFNGVLTGGLETALITACLRYYETGSNGPGWYLLVDQGENHDPILSGPIVTSAAATLQLDVNIEDFGLDPSLWTPSAVVVGPDEFFAQRGATFGASVNTSTVTIRGGLNWLSDIRTIESNGTSFSAPGAYTATWENDGTPSARLRMTRTNASGFYRSSNNSWIPSVMPRAGENQSPQPANPVFIQNGTDGSGDSFFEIAFFDPATGVRLQSQDTSMRFLLSDQLFQPVGFGFSDPINSGGNIWLIGAFVRKPGSL